MLARAFSTTPEWVMWHVRFDRGLIYQQTLLHARREWCVPVAASGPAVDASDFDTLLGT